MFTGSFRPTTGTRHLHRDYNFTGSLVETAPKSLRHSCRSELRVYPPFPEAQTIPSPCSYLDEYVIWRVASPAARIHLRSQFHYFGQTIAISMSPGRHQPADVRKPLEITPLTREQWIGLEVGNDTLEDILEATRFPLHRLIAAVRADTSASEVVPDQLQHLGAISVLTDGKARPRFSPGEQSRPRRHRDREATF